MDNINPENEPRLSPEIQAHIIKADEVLRNAGVEEHLRANRELEELMCDMYRDGGDLEELRFYQFHLSLFYSAELPYGITTITTYSDADECDVLENFLCKVTPDGNIFMNEIIPILHREGDDALHTAIEKIALEQAIMGWNPKQSQDEYNYIEQYREKYPIPLEPGPVADDVVISELEVQTDFNIPEEEIDEETLEAEAKYYAKIKQAWEEAGTRLADLLSSEGIDMPDGIIEKIKQFDITLAGFLKLHYDPVKRIDPRSYLDRESELYIKRFEELMRAGESLRGWQEALLEWETDPIFITDPELAAMSKNHKEIAPNMITNIKMRALKKLLEPRKTNSEFSRKWLVVGIEFLDASELLLGSHEENVKALIDFRPFENPYPFY